MEIPWLLFRISEEEKKATTQSSTIETTTINSSNKSKYTPGNYLNKNSAYTVNNEQKGEKKTFKALFKSNQNRRSNNRALEPGQQRIM